MSWKQTVFRWLGSAAVQQAWPRVKRAASAAWRAFKQPLTPTEPPRDAAPDVAREDDA